MFLNRAALLDLTGYTRPTAVRRWLKNNRIPYVDGGDGWPRVLEAVSGVGLRHENTVDLHAFS